MKLQYVYDQLGEIQAIGLPAMHALSGCGTTGHTQSKSKQSWFHTFLKLPENIQLSTLGICDKPTEHVLTACERYIYANFLHQKLHLLEQTNYASISLKS